MELEKIIACIMIGTALIALITLLFLITIPLAKKEQKEREIKTKMYNEITKYFKAKNDKNI